MATTCRCCITCADLPRGCTSSGWLRVIWMRGAVLVTFVTPRGVTMACRCWITLCRCWITCAGLPRGCISIDWLRVIWMRGSVLVTFTPVLRCDWLNAGGDGEWWAWLTYSNQHCLPPWRRPDTQQMGFAIDWGNFSSPNGCSMAARARSRVKVTVDESNADGRI